MNGVFPLTLMGFFACISFAIRVDDPVGRGLFVAAALFFGIGIIASLVQMNKPKKWQPKPRRRGRNKWH